MNRFIVSFALLSVICTTYPAVADKVDVPTTNGVTDYTDWLKNDLSGFLSNSDNQHLNNVNTKMVNDGCTSYERVQNMSPEEFFTNCITSLSEIAVLQQKYEAARANENRLGNRLLGGLTMAATGAGGMMLGMGLAEQKADREAEERMRGYLSTFRCGYGGAKNIEY
ncbi:MAG: hypothetical protein IKL37_01205, partial [Alphaproteobacteria bacterium]|nr:hypothetical protein [Alphaproteobacteria bacterium]